MGFLQDLGLDDLISSASEMFNEVNSLKDEFINGVKEDLQSGVAEPIQELQGTVQESVDKLKGNLNN